MDPELNEQLRELYYSIKAVESRQVTFGRDINSISATIEGIPQKQNTNTQAQNSAKTGTTKLQQIMNEEDQKNKKFKENLESSFGHSISALISLGGALVSSQTGLQKYSQTVENLGKGASKLGENFGLLGFATGGLLGIFGSLASSILNLNQNTLDLRNNFAKAGGVLPVTTERLGHLAKEAGFALDSMKILGEKMTALSTSMTSLGGTAGEGATKFMQIANVDDSIRRQFGKLGVSQEALLNLQGQYLEMQKVSGNRMENENKSVDAMQRESLQYAKTLITLSSITGKNAEELQKEINSVMLEVEEQNQIATENAQIARLRKDGKHKEADELRDRAENRKKMITVYTSLYGRDIAMQAGRVARTGAIDTKSREVAMLPIEDGIVKATQRILDSKNVASTLASEADNMDAAMTKQNTIFKDVIQQDPEAAKNLGLRVDALSGINNRTEPVSDMIRRVIDDMDAKTDGTQEDQLADSVEGIRSVERESKKLFQTFLENIDPMRNFNSMLTIALGAAAVALAGFTVVKLGQGLLGGLFERGGSIAKPNYIIISGMPGVGGGSSGSAGSASDPTGLGLRKADLVDKNGKPLSGAALDARMKKMAGERLPKTTSFALKQAAKNSGTILKGAATLAGAIATIGAGIAGATWLMGKAIPTFAGGMKKFNEVDGDNLKGVGIGMAGLGAGILALAAETVVGFFNTMASALGAQSPLERAVTQLKEFEKIDVDADKVERNGKAALAFAKALANMPATSVTMSGMLAGFFSGPPMPYAAFEKFAKFEVDTIKAESNSKAFIGFSNALASYTGSGAIDGLGATVTALADAVLKHYEIDPPEERLKKFSDLDINPELVGQNALAFKNFAQGMSSYRSPPGILSTISSLIGTQINKIFGPSGPVDAFVKFSKDTSDISTTAAKNARAFFNFARALGMLSGTSGFNGSGVVSNAVSDIAGFFGVGSDKSSEVDVSKAKGDWKKDAAFVKEVERVSSKYGFSPGALIGLMQSESGINPQARNNSGGATGLIQFMPATARALGTSTDALYRMNRAQQMKYVDAFFSPYASGLKGASAGKLYAYVFLPGRAGRQSGVLTENPENYYTHNRGLDMNRDGRITISDLDRRIAGKAKEAKVGGLFSGPTSGYPMELHGTELIVPVDSNSILMKLATEAASGKKEAISALGKNNKTVKTANNEPTRKTSIDPARMESISSMFDSIIDAIDATDDIDKKILRYT